MGGGVVVCFYLNNCKISLNHLSGNLKKKEKRTTVIVVVDDDDDDDDDVGVVVVVVVAVVLLLFKFRYGTAHDVRLVQHDRRHGTQGKLALSQTEVCIA